MQEIARSRSFRLDDNETMTNPDSFIAAEAESNSQLHSFPVRRVNRVLREQPDKWNLVISQQPSARATASTVSHSAPQLSSCSHQVDMQAIGHGNQRS